MQTDDLSAPNMFRHYVQGENHSTNALVSLLAISRQDNPLFLASFMSDLLGLQPQQKMSTFRVQRDYLRVSRRRDTVVDAEVSGRDICLLFETKIERWSLRKEQIEGHLKQLSDRDELTRYLALLTPDDSASTYIDEHCCPVNR